MSPNFTECAARYVGNETLAALWGYTGEVRGIDHNASAQITYEGCRAVCGDGWQSYDWSVSSATITTWLLPIVGVLLQAPFESNQFWKTIFTIARWVGSPIASLSCILWNIAVSGKCAMMVDMAVPFTHDQVTEPRPDYAAMRDSLYILMNMNMFTIKPVPDKTKEAEGLLRIALFSKDLKLPKGRDGITLERLRGLLAQELREKRRRGVVPVFISSLWFLFSLAISIEGAFGHLGDHTTAHDLALGLLLSWLPVLIMCTIIDRNPWAAENVRKRLCMLVNKVALALQDPENIQEYFQSLPADSSRLPEYKQHVLNIAKEAIFLVSGDFFVEFAGQSRVRWHYGAAQPILSDIETSYIAKQGRFWLHNEDEARIELVLGSGRGLIYFDFRQLWQIAMGIVVVGGTTAGALILSYFTPTVALGCRSGGYAVYMVFALALLIVEYLVWWLTPLDQEQRREVKRDERRKRALRARHDPERGGSITQLKRRASAVPMVASNLSRWREYTARDWINRCLQVVELYNAGWLVYIALAQTFGWFQNCNCMASRFGPGQAKGYIDLSQIDQAPPDWVFPYWTSGTALSCTVMAVALVYVVSEWCLQSHIATEDPDKAANGLWWVRRYRWLTLAFHYPLRAVVNGLNRLCRLAFGWAFNDAILNQNNLIWTKGHTKSTTRPRQRDRASTVGTDGYVIPMLRFPDLDTPHTAYQLNTMPNPPSPGSTYGFLELARTRSGTLGEDDALLTDHSNLLSAGHGLGLHSRTSSVMSGTSDLDKPAEDTLSV